LEVDIGVVKNALTGYLKMKYNLYDDEESGSHLLDYPYMYGLEDEVNCNIGLQSYFYRSHPRSPFIYPEKYLEY
jgi:hypothetical protein